jgi:hypothetical protein
MKDHLKRGKGTGETLILLTWFASRREKVQIMPQSEVFAAFHLSTVSVQQWLHVFMIILSDSRD